MIVENTCTFCNRPARVEVDSATWAKYEAGIRLGLPASTHGIRALFPDLSVAEREILISGTHDECWYRAFRPQGGGRA